MLASVGVTARLSELKNVNLHLRQSDSVDSTTDLVANLETANVRHSPDSQSVVSSGNRRCLLFLPGVGSGSRQEYTKEYTMSRIQLLVIVTFLVAMSVGCCGRCRNPCGGWFAGSSTVAPPPTYSLNIPSVANNQPYYTPGSAAPNSYTVNPNLSAPTPAATGQGQNGWRSANDQLSNGRADQEESRSVLATPTTFVESQATVDPNQANPQFNQPTFRTASSVPLPASGYSYSNSPNYLTTRVDERMDSTRLPVIDASTVRAPARNFPTGTIASYSAPLQQTYVAQNGFYQPVSPYTGSMVMVGGQPVPYQGQTVLTNPNIYPTSSPPAVLAQSTTTGDPVGWRSREMSSDRVNRY